jgi:DNA-binding protein H-NS
MPTLEAIETKIRRLQEQAEAIKAKKVSATLDRIVALMNESGISVADIEAYLGGKKRGPKPGKKTAAAAPAKYMDPKTGATWSGRGRAPAWIASAKNRDRYLVGENVVSPPAASESKAKKQGNFVRGKQPSKYRNPQTGATWSGRGRAPAWLANARDRAKFLIAADNKADAVMKTAKAKSKASSASAPRTRKSPPKGKQPAKYLNPETGATWSGRGPAPAWLAAASDRSQFLIAPNGVVATAH